MTLEELHKRAMDLRQEAVTFCDSAGFKQTSSDIMGSLEMVAKRNAIVWARSRWRWGDKRSATNTEIMRHKIIKMANAIDVYLYAKQHGVEAAMIWKLSQ